MRKNFTPALKQTATIVVMLMCMLRSNSQAPTLAYQPVITGLNFPIDVVNAGDGTNRIFIAFQGGLIRVYDQSYALLGDFLTVSGLSTGGERGLLSIAFHPDYETNRFFYVYYTNANGDVEIARYQTFLNNPNLADPTSKVIVLTIPHPGQSNHNGGKLNFGSEPGAMLYFATGDGGGGDDIPNNAQNGSLLLGKMIRISVNTSLTAPFYSIPSDNPYVSDPNVRDEIWAIGLRNPFRWSFDRITHDIWIGDVGQDQVEEIDFRQAGSTGGINYGWRCYEGTLPNETAGCQPQSSYISPVFEYPNPNGGASPSSAVTGGIVYRGTEFPFLTGYYLSTDYYSGTVYKILRNGSSFVTTPQTGLPNSVASFGESENGSLYALSQNGVLYKVLAVAQAPTPIKLVSFTLQQSENYNDIKWKTAMESNVREFSIQSSADAISFASIGKVNASNQQNGSSYSFRHFNSSGKKTFYRLQTIDNDGTFEYSKIISTSSRNETDPIKLYPPSGSSMLVELNAPFNSIRVVNMYGQIIVKQPTGNSSGITYLNTSGWKKGVYVLIADDNGNHLTKKFLIQ